jgi:hypothetical protein
MAKGFNKVILMGTDEVLRYLLVKVDEKGRKALEEAAAKRKDDGADAPAEA